MATEPIYKRPLALRGSVPLAIPNYRASQARARLPTRTSIVLLTNYVTIFSLVLITIPPSIGIVLNSIYY